MIHYASPSFWSAYEKLPKFIKKLSDKNYELLKSDPKHPSLHLKKVGHYWSVRIGLHYRALGVAVEEEVIWFWIGSHSDYDKYIQSPG